MIELKVEGGRELEAALGKLGALYRRKKAARDALREAAEPIRDTAQAGAPSRSGGPEKTFRTKGGTGVRRRGALKLHINLGTRLSKRQSMMNRRLGKREVEVYVGTRDRVGRLVEFGTRHSRAVPFLRRAWLAKGGPVAVRTISAALLRQIQRQTRLEANAARRKARKKKG